MIWSGRFLPAAGLELIRYRLYFSRAQLLCVIRIAGKWALPLRLVISARDEVPAGLAPVANFGVERDGTANRVSAWPEPSGRSRRWT